MALDDILKERGSRYGEFKYAQSLKEVMSVSAKWSSLKADQKKIAAKISRILNGDPD